MPLLDFNRTVPYKKKEGILGYFQIIFHNFFDLVLLNIIFVFTSLPIFTIGASYTSFIAVCNKYAEDENVYPIKEYFSCFKKNFLKTTLYGIIFTLAIVIISFSMVFYLNLGKEIFVFYFLSAVSLICLLIVLMIGGWFFPCLSKSYDIFKNLIVKSFVLTISNIKKSLLFLLVVLVCAFLIFAFFPYSVPFVFIFPIMLIALASSCISVK